MEGRVFNWLKEHYELGIARWLFWSFVIGFLLILAGFLFASGFAAYSYVNQDKCFTWNPITSFAELFE